MHPPTNQNWDYKLRIQRNLGRSNTRRLFLISNFLWLLSSCSATTIALGRRNEAQNGFLRPKEAPGRIIWRWCSTHFKLILISRCFGAFLSLSETGRHFKLTSAPETASYPGANFYLLFNSLVIIDRNFPGSSSFLCKCLSPVDVIGDTSWSIRENSLFIFITHILPHSHFKNQLTLVRTGWIVTHLTYLTVLVSLWCWFFCDSRHR